MEALQGDCPSAFNVVMLADQSGAPPNGCRFILSLRAVGEGHISSLTFRSGTIAADGSVAVDPTARLASVPKVKYRTAGTHGDDVEVIFPPNEELSEQVIFPITDSQANGIEDARFVEFNDDGQKTFYATYTAYSGTSNRLRYTCMQATMSYGAPGCRSLAGTVLDDLVAERVMQVLAPAS